MSPKSTAPPVDGAPAASPGIAAAAQALEQHLRAFEQATAAALRAPLSSQRNIEKAAAAVE